MSLKRKRVEAGPPGISRRRIPPGIMKAAGLARKRRQAKLRALLARPQTKYADASQAAAEANYDNILTNNLNGINTGDSDTTRDGQKIVMNSLQIKGKLINPDNTAPGAVVRYLIVLDKYPNETAAVLGDVLETASAAADVYSLRKRSGSSQDRFKVMIDRAVFLGGQNASAISAPSVHMFSHYFKMSDVCQFNDDGTGNPDDFQKGRLVFFAISDIATASTGPTVEFESRVTFYDK